jgi:hypothetical protein
MAVFAGERPGNLSMSNATTAADVEACGMNLSTSPAQTRLTWEMSQTWAVHRFSAEVDPKKISYLLSFLVRSKAEAGGSRDAVLMNETSSAQVLQWLGVQCT